MRKGMENKKAFTNLIQFTASEKSPKMAGTLICFKVRVIQNSEKVSKRE